MVVRWMCWAAENVSWANRQTTANPVQATYTSEATQTQVGLIVFVSNHHFIYFLHIINLFPLLTSSAPASHLLFH